MKVNAKLTIVVATVVAANALEPKSNYKSTTPRVYEDPSTLEYMKYFPTSQRPPETQAQDEDMFLMMNEEDAVMSYPPEFLSPEVLPPPPPDKIEEWLMMEKDEDERQMMNDEKLGFLKKPCGKTNRHHHRDQKYDDDVMLDEEFVEWRPLSNEDDEWMMMAKDRPLGKNQKFRNHPLMIDSRPTVVSTTMASTMDGEDGEDDENASSDRPHPRPKPCHRHHHHHHRPKMIAGVVIYSLFCGVIGYLVGKIRSRSHAAAAATPYVSMAPNSFSPAPGSATAPFYQQHYTPPMIPTND